MERGLDLQLLFWLEKLKGRRELREQRCERPIFTTLFCVLVVLRSYYVQNIIRSKLAAMLLEARTILKLLFPQQLLETAICAPVETDTFLDLHSVLFFNVENEQHVAHFALGFSFYLAFLSLKAHPHLATFHPHSVAAGLKAVSII